MVGGMPERAVGLSELRQLRQELAKVEERARQLRARAVSRAQPAEEKALAEVEDAAQVGLGALAPFFPGEEDEKEEGAPLVCRRCGEEVAPAKFGDHFLRRHVPQALLQGLDGGEAVPALVEQYRAQRPAIGAALRGGDRAALLEILGGLTGSRSAAQEGEVFKE